ncbi:unnamed protein product [Linum tenue]|uniref:Uncharacterized protein n=1 Tax=Linum tenue TaxID=586396 RepID=A0AAV0HWY5_9ROSI|nr:unnamed protein product [Linum tenue]
MGSVPGHQPRDSDHPSPRGRVRGQEAVCAAGGGEAGRGPVAGRDRRVRARTDFEVFCQANVVRRVYDHGFACKACESPLAERLRQFLQRYGRVPSPNEGPIREAPRHNVQVIGPSPRRHQVAPLQNQSPPTTGRPPTQLLPGLPRPGPRYGPGPAHGLIPHHSPPPEQQRHRPPNLRRRRQPLDPGEPDPRRAHRQRRRPDAHRHQRAVQDRPASSGREQDTSSRLHGLLLRHATGGEDIATNEAGRRGPSTALPACDVERVP